MNRVIGKFINGILEVVCDVGYEVCGGYISGMFGFFFCVGFVNNFGDVKKSDIVKFVKFYR